MKRLFYPVVVFCFLLNLLFPIPEAIAFAIPKAPVNLTATPVSATQINLAWQDAATDETGFEIERSLNGTTFAKVAELAANTVRYQDTFLNGATKYWYRVRSKNASGVSAYSSIVTAITPPLVTIPKAPGALTVTATSGYQVNLAWTDNATDETAFELERSVNGTTFVKLTDLPADSKTFQDKNLTPVTKYWYRILAKNTAGKSAYSNIATATTLQIPPAAPAGLVATAVSQTQVNVAWQDQSNNETGFQLERSADGLAFTKLANVGANVTTYQNTGLTAATTYYYRVRAVNAAGASAYSPVDSARTLNIPVPDMPVNFTAVPVAPQLVQLRWAAVTGNPARIIVERSKTNTESFAQIAQLAGSATQFEDTTKLEKTDYYYRVKATNAGGSSPYSLVGIVRASSIITSVPLAESWNFYVLEKTLVTEKLPEGAKLRVVSLRGITLYERVLSGFAEVDLSKFPSGIYIVRVEKDNAVLSRKIALY